MRSRARDIWIGVLKRGMFPPQPRALAESCVMLRAFSPPTGPAPGDLVDELRPLAEFATRTELAMLVAERLGAPTGACYFAREHIRRLSNDVTVECLNVEDDNIVLGLEDARWALLRWTRAEPLDHYRLAVKTRDGAHTRFVAFFEPNQARGKYAALGSGVAPVDLAALPSPNAPWDDALLAFMLAADVAGDEAQRLSA
jgi:hypothetical protein